MRRINTKELFNVYGGRSIAVSVTINTPHDIDQTMLNGIRDLIVEDIDAFEFFLVFLNYSSQFNDVSLQSLKFVPLS